MRRHARLRRRVGTSTEEMSRVIVAVRLVCWFGVWWRKWVGFEDGQRVGMALVDGMDGWEKEVGNGSCEMYWNEMEIVCKGKCWSMEMAMSVG